MIDPTGILICVGLYSAGVLVLGAYISAGLLVFHVAVVPLLFRYSKSFRRTLVFANFVQWPLFMDLADPAGCGVEGCRSFSIEYHSKVDDRDIKIGIWHIVPQSAQERLRAGGAARDRRERDRLLAQELATCTAPVILYCHGNSNSRGAAHRIELYKFFQKMDFHTIAFDYRGYGDSTNVSPSEAGVVEDALAVYQWLQAALRRAPAPAPPVFVWGHSLGSGISSQLVGALARGGPAPAPRGLLLEAPFHSLEEEVRHHPLAKLVSWLPHFEQSFVAPFRGELAFRSHEHLARAPALPVLILHARDDVIVPYVVGVKLYESVVQSRAGGGAPVALHSYEGRAGLGHKYICRAHDLPRVVGDFVEAHR